MNLADEIQLNKNFKYLLKSEIHIPPEGKSQSVGVARCTLHKIKVSKVKVDRLKKMFLAHADHVIVKHS